MHSTPALSNYSFAIPSLTVDELLAESSFIDEMMRSGKHLSVFEQLTGIASVLRQKPVSASCSDPSTQPDSILCAWWKNSFEGRQ